MSLLNWEYIRLGKTDSTNDWHTWWHTPEEDYWEMFPHSPKKPISSHFRESPLYAYVTAYRKGSLGRQSAWQSYLDLRQEKEDFLEYKNRVGDRWVDSLQIKSEEPLIKSGESVAYLSARKNKILRGLLGLLGGLWEVSLRSEVVVFDQGDQQIHYNGATDQLEIIDADGQRIRT